MDGQLLKQLETLLGDNDFKSELKVFRGAVQRLRVRLRNNPFVAKLRHLANLTRQLETKFPVKMFQNCKGGKKRKFLTRTIKEIVDLLDKTLEKTIQVYAQSQPHFRIGHLIHHLIVVRSSIARIRACYKALLVYACDLYIEISGSQEFNQILIKHGCKPRIERDKNVQATESEQEKAEDAIGVLIDRATMKESKSVR